MVKNCRYQLMISEPNNAVTHAAQAIDGPHGNASASSSFYFLSDIIPAAMPKSADIIRHSRFLSHPR